MIPNVMTNQQMHSKVWTVSEWCAEVWMSTLQAKTWPAVVIKGGVKPSQRSSVPVYMTWVAVKVISGHVTA